MIVVGVVAIVVGVVVVVAVVAGVVVAVAARSTRRFDLCLIWAPRAKKHIDYAIVVVVVVVVVAVVR